MLPIVRSIVRFYQSSIGKKIYPARIETMFKSEPLIIQVVLFVY